jgi:glycosyltransferase involved in cell wall biosynthesis
MKIALIHDYLAQDGGAERVLKAFHELWPEAPIFVLFHNPEKVPQFNGAKIIQSYLGKLPFISSHFQWYLPLMPRATEQYDLREFDVVLSSTSAFAKGIITDPHTLHISYCHTPARFLWSDAHDYVAELPQNRIAKALFLKPLLHRLRLWDHQSAARVDHFIANSHTVERRIIKYYRRESTIIYPPVETNNFHTSPTIGDYFITGGRLVPYKRFDLAVHAFNRLRYPLKIFGVGPEYERLKTMARKNIEFLGRVSEEEKAQLLSQAKAFIHPQLEDAGVTPLEAMASGRPVIAFAGGGAAETIIPGETGTLFLHQTWESLLDATLHFNQTSWDSARIREHAEQFDTNRFKAAISRVVHDRHEEFQHNLKQPSLFTSVPVPQA